MRRVCPLLALAFGCGGGDDVGSRQDAGPDPPGCFDSTDQRHITLDGTRGFTSLQAALDAAGPGSDLLLCPGLYAGDFVASVPVRLRSLDGWEQTVLAGAGGATLTIPGGSELEGLTVLAGAPGVVVSSAGAVRIVDSLITENQAKDGAGLVIAEKAEVTLVRTRILDNIALGRGGGVWAQPGAVLDLTENSTVEGNWASEFGAGVWLQEAHLRGGVVKDNRLRAEYRSLPDHTPDAEGYGGSGVALTGTGSITDTEIASNEGVGGALSVTRGEAALDRVWVHDNEGEPGGGLWVVHGTVDGNGTTRSEWNAAGGGRAIDSTIRRVAFVANAASGVQVRGGILEDVVSANNSALLGAGVEIVGGARLQRVTVRNNESETAGGGIHIVLGGESPVEILDSVIAGNRALEGAGVFSHPGIHSDSVTIKGTVITDNVATGKGGGVYVRSNGVQIVGGRVAGNQASSGGGTYLDWYATLTVTNTDFGEGEQDNTPDDVETMKGRTFQDFGTDATFACDDLECTAMP